jgi:pimeloyl-ACP methyl ester carboxylesterase
MLSFQDNFNEKMMILLYIVSGILIGYVIATLYLTYLVHQIPRRPVSEKPDWGTITDTKIPAIDGGFLEVWRIDPEGKSKGAVLFAHGWGRNRDRMVPRARMFGEWGFTAVIHSARDHGGSSSCKFMNAMKFAEDIEAVMDWLDEPVILYGHSAGAGGASIAASRNPNRITLLFLEASYAYTKESLLSLYRWYNPFFGKYFAPVVLFWMDLLYKRRMDMFSPAVLAPKFRMPVMFIHGERDQRFPLQYAIAVKNQIFSGQVEMFIAKDADHSESSQKAGYREAVKGFIDRYLTEDG